MAGLIGAAVFLVPGVTVLLALRYQAARAWIHRAAAVLLRPLHRRWGKSWMDPAALEEFLDRVASISLPGTRYAQVFALALVNWLGDCGCLACSILATSQPVPWHGLLLAYAAGAAVGSSGLSPGGFALVEIALTAALTAAGMTASAALAASIAYRLISFWLILIGGGVSFIVLARRSAAPVGRGHPATPARRPITRPAADPGQCTDPGQVCCQELRYSCCAGVSSSMAVPVAASASRATSSSISGRHPVHAGQQRLVRPGQPGQHQRLRRRTPRPSPRPGCPPRRPG